MGEALLLPASDLTLQSNPKLTLSKGAYTYTVETRGNKITYSVTDGTQTISLPVQWTFGQGAKTWIFEREGHYYETLVSYYPQIHGLETTIGDETLRPNTLEQAIGRKLKPEEARDCFACHSTNGVSQGRLMLDSLQPGVTCEHCHSGTTTHLLDAVQGIFDSAPPSLSKLPSEDISNFCGECHRTWEIVVRNHTRGVVNVRFQPYRLANSKCFDGADPRISCIACHDPHQNLVRDDASYDLKCLGCHATKVRSPVTQKPAGQEPVMHSDGKVCPVANANCVSCHMPKVKLPGGIIAFTDHEIRIVKPGESYPN